MTAKKTDVIEETEERELTPLEEVGLPATKEEIQMNEEDLINGLLAAAESKSNSEGHQTINIRRNGVLLFQFKIRPVSEDELMRIRKSSTDTFKNPAGRNLPRIEGDMRLGEFRSKKIYLATAEDEKTGIKIWDNPQLRSGLKAKGIEIMESWEIIDKVLLAGEKDKISDAIDELSGYDADLVDYAKN